mgnify:CR=1 FL=1
MRIVEIAALENGAHRNQTGAFSEIPEGWAVIPEDMALPDTFPFVSLAAENGIITHMSAGAVPDAPDAEAAAPRRRGKPVVKIAAEGEEAADAGHSVAKRIRKPRRKKEEVENKELFAFYEQSLF